MRECKRVVAAEGRVWESVYGRLDWMAALRYRRRTMWSLEV